MDRLQQIRETYDKLCKEYFQKRDKLVKEAERKHITAIVRVLARHLGKSEDRASGVVYILEHENLHIRYEGHSYVTIVKYNNREVFRYSNGIARYRPDIPEWEEKINWLYHEKILGELEKEERKKMEELKKEAFEDWGIRLGEGEEVGKA